MTSENWMVRVRGVSKKFSKSLRQSMHYGMSDSLRRLMGLAADTNRLRDGEFWAVDNVSFDLESGQCLGIMGVNGSGKTTLLRILNGTYAPDAGEVSIRGTVGALIAAGAGFSPVLTGRENIYVNGALLGMSRKVIDERLDEIVAFAEIGDFIDAPVKHYSSGMQVRLGFAIAAASQPQVLLVDEVLAVGDMNFQKKCYEYLHHLKRQGTAILVVSHSIGAIWALCDHGLFLHHGKMEMFGPIEEVIRLYNDRNAPSVILSTPDDSVPSSTSLTLPKDYRGAMGGTGDAVITSTRTLSLDGQPKSEFDFFEPLVLESIVEVRAPISQPVFRYTIDAMHYRFIICLDSYTENMIFFDILPGAYRLRARIPQQNLMPGTYGINANICQRQMGLHLFFHHGACRFKIRQPQSKFLYGDPNAVMYLDTQFSVVPLKIEKKAA